MEELDGMEIMSGMEDMGGDWMFNAFPVIFGIIFLIVISVIIVSLFGALKQWRKNENSPRLSVPAIVRSKRTNVTRGSNHDGHAHSSSTSYYVTFEFEGGDRTEFRVSGKEFGLLAEGDKGTLSFQGSRFLGYNRALMSS